ncbi:all-trans retinoic acid-induced differentiation factor isoform X2 [Paramormyrops kingsleyae]|uniref:all-trans retinoic acid-induced differentiation factor isoform X2 n=1 Tax=Paramormyrops kingsleyae TaxID=1676925 RepID=UPI000CD5FC27|nr:all-trans retinoic acid-induced differentiation factor isoform X2 [Paramormyrops kingsleyae]
MRSMCAYLYSSFYRTLQKTQGPTNFRKVGNPRDLKMTARRDAVLTAMAVSLMSVCLHAGFQQTGLQECHRCDGRLQDGSAVGNFCIASAGLVDGRCCLRHQGDQDTASIIGLDLSNCSLGKVEDLHEAITAVIIDLSANPIVNMSESIFQGFTQLHSLRLPLPCQCPGGNESWETVEDLGSVCLCEGQRDACYSGGNMSWTCPENSLCAPYGPSFVQCSCSGDYHGYKCLRKLSYPGRHCLEPIPGSTGPKAGSHPGQDAVPPQDTHHNTLAHYRRFRDSLLHCMSLDAVRN